MRDFAKGSFALRDALQAAIDGKAKPVGSLGRIEELAMQIGLAAATAKPDLGRAALIVFAGDHGLTAEGVTAYPSEVTALVARMILDGTAGANIAARAAGAEVFLVDAGMKSALYPHPALLERRIASGTANSLREAAMTSAQCDEALVAGADLAADFAARDYGIFALGEIGIGNTSAAALVGHAITGLPLDILTGPGAGLPPGGLEHKRAVLRDVVARAPVSDARSALAQFAGFEMVMLTGAILGAARAGKLIVIDGCIATVCAAAAFALEPGVRTQCVFAHRSGEPAHGPMLDHLGARPILDLGLRLGEGTGAALAIPLIRMAEALLRDMADLPGKHPS